MSTEVANLTDPEAQEPDPDREEGVQTDNLDFLRQLGAAVG